MNWAAKKYKETKCGSLQVFIERELVESFKEKARENKQTQAAAIRGFIKGYLKSAGTGNEKSVLKECLFCGGEPELKNFVLPKHYWYVECKKCKCKTDGYLGTKDSKKNRQEAIKTWNGRA